MFSRPACGAMSKYFFPIPVDHSLAGLSIPLDLRVMNFNLYQKPRRAATRVDDTMGHIGDHLSQV